MSASIYWYDFETFGADPRRDRPAQFAGLRTDLELQPMGEPLTLYCRPADDFLPHPDAVLITGITPQQALEKGLPETEFIGRINEQFSRPNTCVAGYNNLRFDDEVTRNSLYRNFFDPYAREWQNGNSRWDLIDVMRLTHALRPQGITWPKREDGHTSFRLEDLTQANHIEHQSAHDALSDVYATIALARLVKQRQPRLYDYVFRHRTKPQVASLLDTRRHTPVIHASAMYAAELGCIALVSPLAVHPRNKNEIIVYDLRVDPEPFLALDSKQLHKRLYTRQDQLPPDTPRLPVKTIHINKAPVVAPASTLTNQACKRWQIDLTLCRQNLETLTGSRHFINALRQAYQQSHFDNETNPDLMIYSGGFFGDADRRRMTRIHHTPPEQLAGLANHFDDPRLPEMLFRYRARNYPQTLSPEEKVRWEEFRLQRLTDPGAGASITLEDFDQRLREISQEVDLDQRKKDLLMALQAYRYKLMGQGLDELQ